MTARRIIITGAGSGIGKATCLALLDRQDGAEPNRILLVDRDAQSLAALRDEAGALCATLQADLASPDCGDRIVAAALAHMGGIDGIVSNAGILHKSLLADLAVEDFDRMFAINTRATWLLAKAAFPAMKAAGGGSIVATASISASLATLPEMGAYAPSKAALVMIIRQLANEWGRHGIRSNTVSPGPTITGMSAAAFSDRERREARAASIPTGRINEASDIADAIAFLLSDKARQINGIDLIVDGGFMTSLLS